MGRLLKIFRSIYIVVTFLACSCSQQSAISNVRSEMHPTPTVASFFADTSLQNEITPHSYSSTEAISATKQPSTPIPLSTKTPEQIQEISIYDEQLTPNWSLNNSEFMQFEQTRQISAQHGRTALAIKPLKAFGKLFFTVNKNEGVQFLRKRVLGFRLWLMAGKENITTSDLAIAITGSNTYSYWNAEDNSVKTNVPITQDTPLFSETRLYDLNINRSIPKGTWVEVIVWLDNLKFDPEYTYVTGLYLKNDELFSDTFYLDNMDILLEAQL
jgi:hypothetical protein